MPQINLCFLWHMHQPFYKDLISGEYKLPWTRLHALKDYYGMARILEEFPRIRQTFNLVPSMMVQVEEYAAGTARDPFLDCALKPAETLTDDERGFMLRNYFQANAGRMIYRYPRYGALYDASVAQKNARSAKSVFGVQEFRDLQVLSQLAWFDEEFQEHDTDIRGLIEKGSGYSLEDQAAMGRKQLELLRLVIPEYKKLALSGQIEISTTPFYHPILPLICDSNIAAVSHPRVALPPTFQYPEDARKQLEMAREYIGRVFGVAPVGLWPSEGSVSDQAFQIAAGVGFEWAATDNGVLDRTLGRAAGVDAIYRPYRWQQGDRKLDVIFRDHLLSDLIGFVYSGMDARAAAADFVVKIRDNCRGILQSGRDALVPIILDGENAWEYYDRSGREFFRYLYGSISADPGMDAVTVREAFSRIPPEPLTHIFPGSWINANFDIWIGAQEDNKAWEYLLRARQAYDKAMEATAENRALAYEELLIAEGSDWCWWYGPEHDSANRIDFDQLFRDHLANVYLALGLTPPEELSRPILHVAVARDSRVEPTGPVHPVIDGRVTSYFEWLGAGTYRLDARSGSMHGKRFLAREMHYGSDGNILYVRVDFHEGNEDLLASLDVRLTLKPPETDVKASLTVHMENGKAAVHDASFDTRGVQAAYETVLEIAIPHSALGSPDRADFNVSFWQAGLPVDAIPQQGWIEVVWSEKMEWVA
ncbi:MAG: glycoside hydrolase family 57 protein [Acidobacteriota bacterium]|nr:glycoside hydrolase family 57 protein [Acidobacteriota bacterium]